MKSYLKLIRVKHYLKNVLIFLPLFFSKNLFEFEMIKSSIYAFLSFSFICSVIYIINDIKDKDKDRLHATKKHRPIASGKISVKNASLTAIILFILSMICFYLSNSNFIAIVYLLIYLLINILYSYGIKDIPLLDIAVLAAGFLIRVLFGGAVINVEISRWLYLTVLSMALYLVIGKRRNEIINTKGNTREVLKYYTQSFLDKNMYMCLALAIVFYSLWTMDYSASNLLVWTVPLVILICMKYSMNIEIGGDGDPIEVVYGDKILLSMLFLYGISLITFIYII